MEAAPAPNRDLAVVFIVALAARLLFWQLAGQPLLYTHQYHYFTNGLRIAEHPQPLHYVAGSDEWRTWNGNWTIAPLYHLFLAAVFGMAGPHLAAVRALQCAFDALAAVGVAALGRRVAGRAGSWAGIVYALYWPAMEMPTWTLTENLHTPLLVAGIVLASAPPTRRRALASGVLLGFSALARSVSSGFLGLVALWRWWSAKPRSLALGALVAAGGAAVILPWTARNVFVMHDAVLIESAAFENLWWANHFTDKEHYRRQEEVVHSQPTPAEKRSAALHFALRGLRRSPELFVDKVRTNFRHLFRPEGLHSVVQVQRSLEPWRQVGTLLLDDLPLLLALPLFAAFLAAGRPSPARTLIALWTAYYLFMIVVVFHNEIRYRSALMPFVFAGAAGAVACFGDAERRGRWAIGLVAGAVVSWLGVAPYAPGAWRAVSASQALRPALAAAATGNLAEAERLGAEAAARDPRSPRPWADLGRALGQAGHPQEAAAAYRRAVPLSNFANWRPPLGLARYAGDTEAMAELDRASWDADPWLVLEAAWHELPAPATNEVLLARNDYGAVRGFLHPRGLDPMLSAHRLEWARYEPPGETPPPGQHRWTLHRAWVRLRPVDAAPAYDVTLEMGAPFPSTLASPVVRVTANDGIAHPFTLGRAVGAYVLRAASPPAGEPLLLRIDAPTWSRAGEPADQGVRVDRVSVRPAR